MGGLSLETADDLAAGGDSGVAVLAGNAADSLLANMITSVDGQAEMPKGEKPLSDGEIAILKGWIAAGAAWPKAVHLRPVHLENVDWWSLRPLVRPRLPDLEVERHAWVRNPVDAFVAAKQIEHQLHPQAEADRRTLMRRLSFDLLGLPPDPDELAAFERDPDPAAYENLVDRMLASPRYGERWARHWLDVVHYGDTHGYDKDKPRPNAWPYRDYVVRSWNQDKPWGRFVQEQVAGDVLWPQSSDGILGVGFLAAGPWDFITHVEVPQTKLDGMLGRSLDRDDMVRNTAETFVSTTVGCARCHDHKFDPVSQQDYYAMQAVFAAVDRAPRAYDETPEISVRRRALDQRHRDIEQAEQAAKAAGLADDDPVQVLRRTEREAIDQQLAALPPRRWVYAAATAFDPQDNFHPTNGKPREIRVLYRGDIKQPRELAQPGALSVQRELTSHFRLPPESPEGDRRIGLAHWLTDSRQPLTWRSIANRVWVYHFGRGLADTPNDFGRMGQPPSHPELLDWLAVELRDRGESLKHLHRLICTSATYRQRSTGAEFAEVDKNNVYLWRMQRRRLEAEAIRDSVLQASGMLDFTMYGPGFQDFVIDKPEHSPHYEYERHDPEDRATHRRAVYRFIVRSQQQPFMTTLDCADPSMQVDKRNETVTALQALALLNNRFMLSMSRHFAQRLERETANPEDQVVRAFQWTLGRRPDDEERSMLQAYRSVHGLPNLCRWLLNLNEFVFVD